MYRIAICDNNTRYIKIIEKYLSKQKNCPHDICFYEFSSGEQLLENMTLDYNLIFLDMQLRGMDGHETAKALRAGNSHATLVFCSGSQLPTPESFKSAPFRYIIKSPDHSALINELPDILYEMIRKKKHPVLDLTFDGRINRVRVDDVLYIMVEKYGSRVFLDKNSQTCKNNNFSPSLKTKEHIKTIYSQIHNMGFSFAHNSFLVNLQHIVKLDKNSIILDDETILSISRSKKKDFEQKFMQYITATSSLRQ